MLRTRSLGRNLKNCFTRNCFTENCFTENCFTGQPNAIGVNNPASPQRPASHSTASKSRVTPKVTFLMDDSLNERQQTKMNHSNSKSKSGRSFLIPRCRRLTWDLLRFNRQVPLCAHDRICDLSSVSKARSCATRRISWPALMLKAFGLMAEQFPEFRQTWYRWPIAHLYQHPHSIAAMTVQRTHKDQPWLFWAMVDAPENMTLPELQSVLDEYQTGPIRPQYQDMLRLASLPTLFRRLIWNWNFHVAKAGRAQKLGTFFLSTLSGKGAEIQSPPSIQTGCLTYGPLDEQGRCRITIAYDHRVMDGALVADALAFLENVLTTTIQRELETLAEGK